MMGSLEVSPREVYGNLLYYPANDLAFKFLKLVTGKTFSIANLKVIESLGYEVKMTVSSEAVNALA